MALRTDYSVFYTVSGGVINQMAEAINSLASGGGGGATPTLDSVLTEGNESSKTITLRQGSNFSMYAPGASYALTDDNTGTQIGPGGVTIMRGGAAGANLVVAEDVTEFVNLTMPQQSGVLALVSQALPTPPATGTYTLQSVDGVVSWVAV